MGKKNKIQLSIDKQTKVLIYPNLLNFSSEI